MKPKFLLPCLAGLLAMQCTARAEYYSFDVPAGSDIITQEVRYPVWAESTYSAIWSNRIEGPKGAGVYFYGGVPEANPADPEGRPASIIWSFWPVYNPVTPGDTVKVVWCHPQMYAPLSVGEGASGKAAGQWPLLKTGAWYQFVLRLWHPLDAPGQALAGQWLRDPADNHWYQLATVAVPFDATGFNGQGGFIEDFSHGNRLPRRTDFRHVYGHTDSGWKSAAKFTPSVRSKGEKGQAELIEDGTAAYFETCSGADYHAGLLDYDNNHREVTVTLQQPAMPQFPAPEIAHAGALRNGSQILVTWDVPPAAAPQLGYKAEAVDAAGKIVALREERDPEARQALLDAGAADVAGVKITLHDIFDQTRQVAIGRPQSMPLNPACVPSEVTAPGLDFTYVEAPGGKPAETWNTLSAFAALTPPVAHGTANGPDLSQRRRRINYALTYTGFLRAAQSGIYHFRLSSYDGSRLLVDGQPVVDNDGIHSFTDKSGAVGLAAGLHAVSIAYFRNTARGEGNAHGDRLLLEWEGPSLPRQMVPPEAFYRVARTDAPRVRLTSPAATISALPNTEVPLAVDVQPVATAISRVSYFVDDTLWATSSSAPWGTTTTLPEGPLKLRARVVTNDGAVYDSPPMFVRCQQADTTPWHVVQIGTPAPRRPMGAAVNDKGSIYLVGDGLNFAWQEIDGDATLIAHIAQRPNPRESGQDDGTRPEGNWLGGLLFRPDLLAHDTFLGDEFCTAYAQADGSTHLQCQHDRNGGGPVAGPDLGYFDWIKLERRADTFTASFSKDGQGWQVKGTRTVKLPRKLDAGVCIYNRPGFNNNINAWRLDHVSISHP
jgi:hypothetical protein